MKKWELEAKRKRCLCGEKLEALAHAQYCLILHCLVCGRLLYVSKVSAGIMWYKPEIK